MGWSAGPSAYGFSITAWWLGSKLEFLNSELQKQYFKPLYEVLLLLPFHFITQVSHSARPRFKRTHTAVPNTGKEGTYRNHPEDSTVALHFLFPSLLPPFTIISESSRVVLSKCKSDYITSLLKTLQWLPVSLRVKAVIIKMTYKTLHNLTSCYLSKLIFHCYSGLDTLVFS